MNEDKTDDLSELEGESGGGWLTTYSDMVTLLLTFFVLLFAISNVDAQKFALLAAGLSKDGITAEEFLEIQEKYNMSGVGTPDPSDIEYPGPDEDEPNGKLEGELDTLHALIVDYIKENELQDSISVHYDGEQLLLTLANDVWFASGSAEVTEVMQDKAAKLAHLLRDTQNEKEPFDVIVVGHTDNVPINTSRYPSNWDLSVDRAVKFLDLLIKESGLSSGVFSARGRGEEAPVADNDTPEGQQKNRRVEVMISQLKK